MRALDEGTRRFQDTCASQPLSKWPAARVLIASSIEQMVGAIEAEVAKVAEGRGMTGAKGWGPAFMYMEPKVIAAATICNVLNAVALRDRIPMAGQVVSLGGALERECHFTILKQEAPRLKAVMERRIKRWEPRSLSRAMSRIDEQAQYKWDTRTRRAVGAKAIDILMASTDIIRVYTERRGNRTVRCMGLTPEITEHILKMNEHLEIMAPTFQPMVVPPNPWGVGRPGGYRLLSTYIDTMTKGTVGAPPPPDDHGPMVYGAINALQATPWRVNTTVLRTMEQMWKLGGDRAGLPRAFDLKPATPYPVNGTPDEQTEWKRAMAKVWQVNARAVGQRIAFTTTLDTAQCFEDKVFYFPYQYDFRGRVYPIPAYLQPQGNDVSRGLLTFADGMPLGKSGLWWLRVQYANCWGIKGSFCERVAWADEKLTMIVTHQKMGEYERTPLNYTQLWAEADDPWQALATLIEILNAYASGNPEEYECSLPVNVDGSNSGLQHFSAMIRDPVGARLVNLTPAEQPADIYSDVAVCVEREVRADSTSGPVQNTIDRELLAHWLSKKQVKRMDDEMVRALMHLPSQWLKQGIKRDLCKRPTMTFCYGVTQQGLKTALADDGFLDWTDHPFPAVQYIGKKIWAGITENITGAAEVMDWLRKCAKCANKADRLMEWWTPAGFHVHHPYVDYSTERISCMSGEVYFAVHNPDAGIRPGKQVSALPPNFVHSFDACHLMMTVAAGWATGIHYFMMIHDSFGTHAGMMEHLNLTLREEFVKLYTGDVLENFRLEVIDQTGHDPGPPPERGTFDINLVLKSPYFFG